MVIKKIKQAFSKKETPEYIEIEVGKEPRKSKVLVRPFVLKSFDDVTKVLNVLREGYTIAVIDIGQLRSKDIIEVKRAVAKIKKTVEALEGDIAGFGENILIATPNFAEIYKGEKIEKIVTEEKTERQE
ncbi:MAG: cell division protein SepF [Candidatus Pacearchaeota archaeon]